VLAEIADQIDSRACPAAVVLLGNYLASGRVWYEPTDDLDENTGLRASWGGGLFLSPLDVAIIRMSYFRAKDDFQVNVGVNFSF